MKTVNIETLKYFDYNETLISTLEDLRLQNSFCFHHSKKILNIKLL